MEKSTITAKAAAAIASAASISSIVKPARESLRAGEPACFKRGPPAAGARDFDGDAVKRPGKWRRLIFGLVVGLRVGGGAGGRRRDRHRQRRFLHRKAPSVA